MPRWTRDRFFSSFKFSDNRIISYILFAEDDPDTRDVVQFLLSHAGFRVSAAENAAEVLLLLATERFDAFLLDNWMPELSGLELCRHIRTFDQTTPDRVLLRRSYKG